MYCVVDTERIKGNLIYLLSYHLYNERCEKVESVTFQDVSIPLDNRKAPKRKVEELTGGTIKVNSFAELYEAIREKIENNLLIVFSTTDVGVFKTNCKQSKIEYHRLRILDLQDILYELSTDDKHKSNLKDFCKKYKIPHDPHIPDSDCGATFAAYRVLLAERGEEYMKSKIQIF